MEIMWLKRILIGAFILMSSVTVSLAQTKSWIFNDELCTYKGYYDSKKYTEKQLSDTYTLFFTNHYVSDYGTLEELNARFDSAIHHVETLQVVQSSYFQHLKKDVLRYLKETSDLKRAQKKAREKSEHLIAAVKAGTWARKYAEALHKGGNDLLQAYERVVKEQMKTNNTPEYLWYNYETTMKRADRLDRAFDYVLVYRWWNSANHLVHHINYDGTQMKRFQKLFIKIDTVDCDEP